MNRRVFEDLVRDPIETVMLDTYLVEERPRFHVLGSQRLCIDVLEDGSIGPQQLWSLQWHGRETVQGRALFVFAIVTDTVEFKTGMVKECSRVLKSMSRVSIA